MDIDGNGAKKNKILRECFRIYGPVANRQLRRAVNPFPSGITGSTPVWPTIPAIRSYLTGMKPHTLGVCQVSATSSEVEHLPFKQGVRGALPRWRTIRFRQRGRLSRQESKRRYI